MNILKDLIASTENDMASIVEDGVFSGDILNFIDTGSYVFNALLSGSIYGGIASNKITAFCGSPQTGKSFFVLGIVKNFLETNPNSVVIYFESEGALTKQIIVERGIDIKRMAIIPVDTVQNFRTQILKVLEKYEQQDKKDRQKLLICLDSLGQLASEKEVFDATSGRDITDMSRARIIKGLFRILTLKLAKVDVSLIITNHVYKEIGSMYPREIMSSGMGLAYAASTIVFLSRKKEKDGDEVVGNIIHCKNFKNRLARENKMVDVLLTYDKGLNRYYGLSDLAIAAGIFKKPTTRIELPDGTKVFEKALNNNPEKYYTEEILNKLNEVVKQMFLYGTSFIGEQDGKTEEETND